MAQIRRGSKEQIPTLKEGELGYCLDTKELFIGGLNGNDQIVAPIENITDDEITEICVIPQD